jgi:hypothetical protein
LTVEAAETLKLHSVAYVMSLLHSWRILKAGDTSRMGTFKTSTILALCHVIDENKKDGVIRLIGYGCKQTKYGKVFFIYSTIV